MSLLTLQTRATATGSQFRKGRDAVKPCSSCNPRQSAVARFKRRTAQCSAAAVRQQQLEGAAAQLATAGMDISKLAAAPGSGGLVTSKAVGKGDQLFAVPQTAWITAKTAQESEIGSYLAGLQPWLAIALFLLHERSKGGASRWSQYLSCIPADSGSPVQWEDDDLAELQGTQLLGTVQAYKAFYQQRYEQLQAELFGPNCGAFDPSVYTYDAFAWATCTVRGRSHTPLVGDDIALVPFADLVQHQRGGSMGWKVRQVGGLFGAGSAPALVMEAVGAMAAGAAITMDYGKDKSDGQLLVDHGVLDSVVSQPSYTLTLELSPEDRFHDDKADVLEINGLSESIEILLRGDSAPDQRLLPVLRLLNLSGADAFLLESIFRNEVWDHLQLPVSEENEACCYQQLIDGCKAALAGYPTTIDEDLALLNSGSLEAGSRRQRAVRVRLGEKEALDATLTYFEERISRLKNMEYYAERRLKRLGLLDDDGKTTWDGFFEDGIA